jgi:hypothetical protein
MPHGLPSLDSTLHVGGVDGRWLGSLGQMTGNLEDGGLISWNKLNQNHTVIKSYNILYYIILIDHKVNRSSRR